MECYFGYDGNGFFCNWLLVMGSVFCLFVIFFYVFIWRFFLFEFYVKVY